MHSKPISLQLHWIVLLACAALVVALTTLPASVGLIRALHGVTLIHGHPNANDAIGHAALYGTLAAVIYWALRPQLGFTRAFWIALIGAMLTGATTEFIQQFSPGRTMMLSDLLANWLGAMTVAMLIGFRRSAGEKR